MASIGTLWTIPAQGGGKRIRAVAALGGINVDLPEKYTHYEDNKKPEFTNKFPHGKIPAFEGKDGFYLFEGSAIARYFASLSPNANLLGTTPKEAALVDQWVSFGDLEIGVFTSYIGQLVAGHLTPYAKPIHNTLAERQIRSFGTLEKHLSTRTFLVNERITLADIAIASVIQNALKVTFDAPLRARHPNIVRHFETVVNQPKLKDIYGETEYIEKAKQFVAPPKDKKEAAKPAAAAAAAPKAEKKPKAKEQDDDDDDVDLVPQEPKAKNPLDSLPKSEFNLEDWKRAYSNMDTRGPGGSLEWFYQKFDKEGFSVWRVDFKYNQELTQVFMSSNQIGGFFNRLEASRKYLFGSVGVLGTANNSIISGVLILRGHDVKPVVDVAPDWESYEFKRLDLANADDKKFFEAALAWDLEIGDKKWADGKNFK
ncbi:elongation factor 1-gamma [Rickenella mellea]|uniref:Elongation factor 1-gamma n=1 Tax=Rickenella mellea TaxID=50990 RepID=A0A4Y7QHY6_9AGAM|nr:elongation factor 1-gamma [Rickenella mellea]